jgi:hypothetical protein
MVTMSAFDRRLMVGDQTREVSLESGQALWIPAQTHAGENIGTTESHSIFIELKESGPKSGEASLGPQPS